MKTLNQKISAKALPGLLLMLIATSAGAAESASQLEMTVIRDRAQGDAILRGQLDPAIDRLQAAKGREDFARLNNLCVAYARAGELEQARAACDSAIDRARDQTIGTPPHIARIYQRDEALALTNRGVLAAMRGQDEAARADFEAAIELSDGLSAPGHNLALLAAR